MLILLSPAKTLDFSPADAELPTTKPTLLAEAHRLAKQLKQFSSADLQALMGVSDKLAATVRGYFVDFKTTGTAAAQRSKPAALAFRGDVYQGLAAETLAADDWDFAQRQVRILSGLYGVLRPLDLIQPYRLEMGTELATDRGGNLYEYWGDRIRKALAKDLRGAPEPVVVNLASQEYIRAAGLGQLGRRVVTPSFRDLHNGNYKVLSFFAKRARGVMARWLIERRADSPDQLLKFRRDGYRLNRELSQPDAPVFTRDKA